MDKRVILLGVAVFCVGLYFYGQQIKKDNQYLKWLPAVGGGAYALNFVINLATN